MEKFINRVIDFFKPPTGWNRQGALSPDMLKTVKGTRAGAGQQRRPQRPRTFWPDSRAPVVVCGA